MARRIARTGGFRRSGGANFTWGRVRTQLTTVAFDAKAVMATFTPSTQWDETIRRVRGILYVDSDQAGVHEQQEGAIGAFVASDTAVTAGAASLLGPVTDLQDDAWMMWMPFAQATEFADGGAPVFKTWEFDSKAMRKLVSGHQLVFMIENGSGVFGLRFLLYVSVLGSFKR